MQRRLISGIKENLKAFKQEIKGAEIYDTSVKLNNVEIFSKGNLFIETQVKEKKPEISINVNEKLFLAETSVKALEFFQGNFSVEGVDLYVSSQAQNYKFEKFETKILEKQLEEFYTIAKFKEVELTKKSKVHEIKINKFRRKVYDGTDKIRKVPVTIEGRKFLSNKELIDLAIKIKMKRKDLDFTKFNFKAIFENLLVDYIEDYQYIDDTAELKIYYKKYSKEESERKNLIILTEKNSLNSEKIFI
ncbi:MAG: hypothetical protein JW924_02320 [Fusobacteriaceae bacterium]|nr:hypothetical protein [Fusobacteriaceae bacterium]